MDSKWISLVVRAPHQSIATHHDFKLTRLCGSPTCLYQVDSHGEGRATWRKGSAVNRKNKKNGEPSTKKKINKHNKFMN